MGNRASTDRLLEDILEVLDASDSPIENRLYAAMGLVADLGSICMEREEFLELLGRSYDLAQASDVLESTQSGIRPIRPRHG